MTTSLGYKTNKNPLAQSFYVDEPTGIYITKVDLYFAERDTNFAVSLQIRPMINGYPSSSEILPSSTVVIPGNLVNTSSDASTPTSFEFDEPLYLKGLIDYALVITANSENYKV